MSGLLTQSCLGSFKLIYWHIFYQWEEIDSESSRIPVIISRTWIITWVSAKYLLDSCLLVSSLGEVLSFNKTLRLQQVGQKSSEKFEELLSYYETTCTLTSIWFLQVQEQSKQYKLLIIKWGKWEEFPNIPFLGKYF